MLHAHGYPSDLLILPKNLQIMIIQEPINPSLNPKEENHLTQISNESYHLSLTYRYYTIFGPFSIAIHGLKSRYAYLCTYISLLVLSQPFFKLLMHVCFNLSSKIQAILWALTMKSIAGLLMLIPSVVAFIPVVVRPRAATTTTTRVKI